ncbi:hypothetical protein J6590_079055 [Homalodisca vitripennis]|nr:hypothetical protein J6590_079055 [Homalodisca vitripennis]
MRLVYSGIHRREQLKYKAMFRRSKADSCQRFVGETGNDPFGFIYKLGADKLRLRDVMTTFRITDQEFTEDMEGTLRHILRTLMTPDAMDEEDEEHQRIRETRTPVRLSVRFPGWASTVDAIQRLLNWTTTVDSKHAVRLFLNIKGAIDGVWWPAVFHKLRQMRVSMNIYRIIENYLPNRTAYIEHGSCRAQIPVVCFGRKI